MPVVAEPMARPVPINITPVAAVAVMAAPVDAAVVAGTVADQPVQILLPIIPEEMAAGRIARPAQTSWY